MPDENKEFVLKVSTNAAQAAEDVRDLSDALNDLGESQEKESGKEEEAERQRARAASNLRGILEEMLAQLRQVNSTLGDVSAASVRTADTAERAFKKVTAYERALRKEKQLGDREEAKRQTDAKENFKAEQSRTHDRLRSLKLLAAGGAVLGIGKMAWNMAASVAGRGMAFVNAGTLTGVDPRYMQGLGYLLKQRGGSEGAAIQSIGALSQALFGIQRGYANPDAAAAQYLGNAPWRGSTQDFLGYLADRLPQLSPQETVAATSGLGLSPELIALLREAGSSEGWRKMISGATSQAVDLAKDAKDANEFLAKIYNGVDKIRQYASKAMAWLNRKLSSGTIENIGAAGTVATGLLGLKLLWNWLRGKPAPMPPGAPAAPPAPRVPGGPSPRPAIAYPSPNVGGLSAGVFLSLIAAALGYKMVSGAQKKLEMENAPIKTGPYDVQQEIERNKKLMERFNIQVSHPLGFMGGRDFFNLSHGGDLGNADNRQLAVNVENINITTRDDPQSMAGAAKDGLWAAGLELIDRSRSSVYKV